MAYVIGSDSVLFLKEHAELIDLGFRQSTFEIYTYKKGCIGILDHDIYVNDEYFGKYNIETIRYLVKWIKN